MVEWNNLLEDSINEDDGKYFSANTGDGFGPICSTTYSQSFTHFESFPWPNFMDQNKFLL
jgi:hypothetical protein